MCSNENWKEYSLKDISLDKGQYGIAESAIPYQLNSPRYLRITDITDDGFLINEGKVSVNVNSNQYEKYLLKKNDIVFARTGASAGRSYVYEEKVEPLIVAGFLIRYRLNPEIVNSRFMRYYTISRHYRDWVNSIATGSTRPNINQKMFSSMRLYLPPLEEQQKIVNILTSFDEKIENNMSIISNLEEQAQATFKSWFVDFEPFQYQEFVNSELGEIPKEWKVVSLSEITELSKESFKPKNSVIKNVYHFSIPAYDDNEYPVYDEVETIKSSKYIINSNSILVSKLNPATQRVWFPNIKDDELNVSSTEFLVLNSNDSETKSFIYEMIKSTAFYDYLTSNVTGTTNSRQRVKPKVAMDFKLAIHPEIIRKFGKFIIPSHLTILNLRAQNIKLAEIRDTLLPKLLSGELPVGEAIETY